MSVHVSETDFSADDSIEDLDFNTTGSKRKSSLSAKSGPALKKVRVNSQKIIFKEEFYTEVEKISDKTTCAKCVACHRVIRGSGEVTSNFIKHLQVKHSECFKTYKSYKIGSPFGGNMQSEFDGKLLHAMIDCSLPLSILEKKSFIDLFQSTGMKVMCRQTAAKKLETKYTIMMENVKENMVCSKYFCTTADVWSGNHRSFLGYTCHWLTDNFERKSAALACRRICGAHTAGNIAQMITEINTAFGLNSSNIVLTITDNGSNFLKAFRDYGVGNDFFEDEINDEMPDFDNESLLPTHQRCCSHTLNLLASTDFDKILKTEQPLYIQHKMTFDKCYNLWKKCKWPKSSEIIEGHLGSSLVLPVVTRWNSLHDAVKKLLCYKEKLNNLCDKLTLPQFSARDIQYLEMYNLVMEPIAKALDFLQGESNINYGFLIPTLVTLSNRLHKLCRSQELQQLSSLILKMEQRLRERFQPYFMLKPEANIAIAATVLTQSIKMKWVKVLLKLNPELPELTVENITSRVLETLYRFYAKNCKTFNFERKINNV
ncbi:uncharacterized protein LOC126766125 isoform X3 [Bactrocera neohumeralis]|nr:uncharacterized protein LOC126766125 isoform X3 [Bactrocera neohumeralis]